MSIHGYIGNVITANPTAPTVSVATGVWTTEQQLQAIAAGNWPGYEYPISRSLRFNSADSAYLNRTPASATNRQIWTWSAWFKRCNPGTRGFLFSAGTNSGTDIDGIEFNTDSLRAFSYNGSFVFDVSTNALFRDPSAWYHIVVALDTTQATNTNRIKIYVNNVQQTFASATYPSQNANSDNINNTVAHYLGTGVLSNYGNGYLTEVNFIDGQALEPSSFGLNDPETGVWSPKRYTGTYGTNGFYVNFSDNSGTTSTTLGKDNSGNGNNWTPNNFSVTAGAGNDSLVDSPTSYGTDTGAGGEVRGNYATLNPLNKNTSGTLSNGNLEWQASTTAVQVVTGTSAIIPSGKTYFELNVVTAAGSGTFYQVGIAPPGKNLTNDIGVLSGQGYSIEDNQASDIRLRLNGTSVTVSTAVQNGDVLQVAVDYATGKLWFGRNNTWYNSSGGTTGNPGAGTNETATISTTTDWFPAVAKYSTGGSYAINFGQRPFAYTAPSGFKALCTQNLPTPTIGATSTTQANKYMDIKLYTGNGGQQTQSGLNFQPDFIWVKSRSNAYDNGLANSISGTGKYLISNSTSAEVTDASGSIIAFNSNGFGQGGSNPFGANGATYVAWAWNAASSNATNTSGSVTSTVRANTTSGFSIVTYTGTGANATVGHGLGVAPSMIIIKRTNSTNSWQVYHSNANASPASGGLFLNTTDAFTALSTTWNSTVPASTVFSIGTAAGTNASGGTYVAYCFAPVAGYSAFGSYAGNGSTDGPFVYLGFRPEFVMIKNATTAGTSWEMFDNARETSNLMDLELLANSSAAEGTYTYGDFVSNGFKLRSTNNGVNQSSATLIYMAFAENPFKYALAR